MADMRDLTDDGDMRATLARLLREAETAHAEYERSIGHADADWPEWYARYLVDHLPEQP